MTESRRLWFALVVPPLAFGLAGAAGWLVGDRVCTEMSIRAVRTALGAVTIVMFAIVGTALTVSLGSYRRAEAVAADSAGRVEFMALGGVLVSASLLVGLMWFAWNPLFIDVCGGMR